MVALCGPSDVEQRSPHAPNNMRRSFEFHNEWGDRCPRTKACRWEAESGQVQCNSVCPLSAMCGRLQSARLSSRLQHWSVSQVFRPLSAARGPLAIMPCADQVPVNSSHSTMRWHMCGRLGVARTSSRLQHWWVQPCVRPLSAARGPLAIMPCADQVPVNSSHSTMRWHKWVVLIAGSTGSALRAVRPPNFHITPDIE